VGLAAWTGRGTWGKKKALRLATSGPASLSWVFFSPARRPRDRRPHGAIMPIITTIATIAAIRFSVTFERPCISTTASWQLTQSRQTRLLKYSYRRESSQLGPLDPGRVAVEVPGRTWAVSSPFSSLPGRWPLVQRRAAAGLAAPAYPGC